MLRGGYGKGRGSEVEGDGGGGGDRLGLVRANIHANLNSSQSKIHDERR